jgi:hypothetical protein
MPIKAVLQILVGLNWFAYQLLGREELEATFLAYCQEWGLSKVLQDYEPTLCHG